MAVGNIYVCIFAALVAVNLIFANEDNSLLSDSNQEDFSQSVSRKERSIEEIERLFSFSVITSCNYTATPGSTCASCTQALLCFSTNAGLLRTCKGLLPYCNSGRCSFIPGSACNTTSG